MIFIELILVQLIISFTLRGLVQLGPADLKERIKERAPIRKEMINNLFNAIVAFAILIMIPIVSMTLFNVFIVTCIVGLIPKPNVIKALY